MSGLASVYFFPGRCSRRNQDSFEKQHKHDSKNKWTHSDALKTSSQIFRVALLNVQTILDSSSFCFPCQNNQTQILFISSLGAVLSLIRNCFWDVEYPTRDWIVVPFGTHLVPTVIFCMACSLVEDFDVFCFFLAKMCSRCFLSP